MERKGAKRDNWERQVQAEKNFHKRWRFSKENRKALTEMLVFTSFFKVNPNCVQQVF